MKTIFRQVSVFNGHDEQLAHNRDVIIEDGTIAAIAEHGVSVDGAEVIEGGGRVLMPGLIDNHVHIYATTPNVQAFRTMPPTYAAHYAARFMDHALKCGFTTIRDVGGGDIGAANALRDKMLVGPRLYFGGRALSQTGGHGDLRHAEEDGLLHCCGCGGADNLITVVVDGVDAVRAATREELRRGASHIKIMGSGGVASPTDPLDRCQFADEEILAIVDEATRWGSYVAAHCHPTEAIRRCAQLGVRTIEHGSLIDQPTAAFVAEKGAFVVPTLATAFALKEDGPKLGLPPVSYEKLLRVVDRMVESLEIMHAEGVQMGFGTDLLGAAHVRQCTEFTLRAKVLRPIDILRAACSVNAEILNENGRLGRVVEGAHADLLLVDGNPLEDISLLAADGEKLAAIMLGGKFVKRAC
ncbi:amidohydrolase family protein [Aurantiacibacter sp. MUD11]|uniref:metal-dependent hydrolase family protein n=1 Tax=Aurantiacibacter sp. MUD11 TaxID=3003265 RepID=UPI0022AA10C6|nr:amidohydrolase family protein [Aurantiacibacter sp. MUD11]WAT17607.1 amidohydrolase family protein [Aurantiacibacter sp. MUD11]